MGSLYYLLPIYIMKEGRNSSLLNPTHLYQEAQILPISIRKLRFGISGQLEVWIKKWLTGRRQRVVINGRSSGWADVESGVQGSSLGPILFTIFINDIDEKVSNLIYIIKKLADDTKLGHKVNTKDDRKALQIGLALLLKWTMDWGMQFNIPKCKALHVGRNNHNFKYYINKIELQNVNEKET